MMDAIALFDIDTMKGMSFAIVPVKTSQPESIASELKTVFASDREGPMAGMVQFLPNKRLSSILVISPQPQYLRRAETWIRRLDAQAQGSEKQLFTYSVQNRRAQELVDVLQSMFSTETQFGSKAHGRAQLSGCQRPVVFDAAAGWFGHVRAGRHRRNRKRRRWIWRRRRLRFGSGARTPSAPAASAPSSSPSTVQARQGRRRRRPTRQDRRRRCQERDPDRGDQGGLPAYPAGHRQARPDAEPGADRGHDRRGHAERRAEVRRAMVYAEEEARATLSATPHPAPSARCFPDFPMR